MRRLDTMFTSLEFFRGSYNFPNVNSNSTVLSDETVTGVALGDMILSWTPASDATQIDDLIIQMLIIATDTVRVTLTNPTGGAIDAGSIDLIILVGTPNPDIDP